MTTVALQSALAARNAVAARARFLRSAAATARPADRLAAYGEADALEALADDLEHATPATLPGLLAAAAGAADLAA